MTKTYLSLIFYRIRAAISLQRSLLPYVKHIPGLYFLANILHWTVVTVRSCPCTPFHLLRLVFFFQLLIMHDSLVSRLPSHQLWDYVDTLGRLSKSEESSSLIILWRSCTDMFFLSFDDLLCVYVRILYNRTFNITRLVFGSFNFNLI